MYKRPINVVVLISVLFVIQACSWTSNTPGPLDNSLIDVMQKPASEPDVVNEQKEVPLRIHYELKHRPLPNQELAIALEIKPDTDLSACAYSIKVSEGLKIIEPDKVINLGNLKAGETYNEKIWIEPVREGLHEVRVFIAAEATEKQPMMKSISIPISAGPFQKSR